MTRLQYLLVAVLLGAVITLPMYSIDTSLPAMPAMAAALGTGTTAIQMSLSALMLGSAIGQLFVGPLSDRFGRRPILFGALALFIAASAGCAFSGTADALIAFRFVQGLSTAGGRVLPRAVARDLFDREDAARLLSYMMLFAGAAPILAPIIGGHFTSWFGWSSVFVFMALYAALVLAMLWLFLEETLPARDAMAISPGRMVHNAWLIVRNRRFRSYAACNACATGGLFAYLAGVSTALIRFLGETPEAFGFDLATVMIGAITFNLIGARLVGRLGIERLLLAGTALAAGGGLAMALLATTGTAAVWAIVAPMFAYMGAYALIVPQATAGALSPFPDIAGTASSLLGFLQILAGTAVATAVGLLDDGSQMPMAIGVGAMGTAGLLSYLLLVRRLPAAGGGASVSKTA